MDYHKNARLTVSLREELAKRVIVQGVTLKLAAASFNVSAKTAAKWVGRYREQGRRACQTAARARAVLHGAHRPLYWKRFCLFAGCAITAGASPARWA